MEMIWITKATNTNVVKKFIAALFRTLPNDKVGFHRSNP